MNALALVCEALKLENAYLRNELALSMRAQEWRMIERHGVDPMQARLLLALYEAKGRTLSALQLVDAIGSKSEYGSAIKVHVSKIRRVLGAGVIRSQLNYGYYMDEYGRRCMDRFLDRAQAA